MSTKSTQIIFRIILSLLLFSYWAGFALLIVNPLFHKDLPGYRIGRICIWELVAIIIAGLIAHWIIQKWGNVEIKENDNQRKLQLNSKYGTFFLIYFIIGVVIAIWQFWLFSQKF